MSDNRHAGGMTQWRERPARDGRGGANPHGRVTEQTVIITTLKRL
ncbi:hypothetical protein [Solemya velum gill symbiont]|nr:hypothetical protein [Solemya velum gill symbiont]